MIDTLIFYHAHICNNMQPNDIKSFNALIMNEWGALCILNTSLYSRMPLMCFCSLRFCQEDKNQPFYLSPKQEY